MHSLPPSCKSLVAAKTVSCSTGISPELARCAVAARAAACQLPASRLSAARDSAFSFHTSPPMKNSFFQMGTSAFSSSMAQWHACEPAFFWS